MNKVLPSIEMPSVEKPTEEESIIQDNIEVEGRGIDIEEKNIDMEIINVEPRDTVIEEDVFTEPLEKPKVVDDDTLLTELTEPKKGKRKYVRKQPMTQKQKDHLSRIRKIAQDKRKAEKEKKEQAKEEAQLQKVEERLLKKKQKEEEDVAEGQKEEIPPAQPKKSNLQKTQSVSDVSQGQMYSNEDLEKAMFNAVATYDSYRRQEKKEKKAKLEKDSHDKKVQDTIQRAIKPQAPSHDPWRSLFT